MGSTVAGAPVLTFLGAAGTVTGSKYLLRAGGSQILVDCGLFQGLKELRERNRAPFPVAPSEVDAVLLTHAHLDHVGYLPALVRNGFRGPVYCTANTAALAGIVLPDSGRLQEEEASYANRKGFSKHTPALPLYTEEDAVTALRYLEAVPFGVPVDVAGGLTATWSPAGHILGAAGIRVTLDDTSIFFSGDVGRPEHPVLVGPHDVPQADTILVESTYGDRTHDTETAKQLFREAIVRTAARGGVVVIPAFAVDRTEVLLFHLRELMEAGAIPDLPVYADSPMALSALAVYRRAIEAGDPEIRAGVGADPDPFDPGRLIEARTPDESRHINGVDSPCIIVSASGMATGGRVIHHLARRLPNRRNCVILPGFQAAGTRGRTLSDGATSVKMLGRYVPVRAEVVTVPGFSVHADAGELTSWLSTAPAAPAVAYVVHGEPHSSAALVERVEAELGWTAAAPSQGERVRLD